MIIQNKRTIIFSLTLFCISLTPSVANASHDSNSWNITKPESFTLSTTSKLSERGPIELQATFPKKDQEILSAYYKQQTSPNPTKSGICRLTMDDHNWPGYGDSGGLGILAQGQENSPIGISNNKLSSNSTISFSKHIGWFYDSSAKTYNNVVLDSNAGTSSAINVNGTDLYMGVAHTNTLGTFWLLKDMNATLSTDNWDAGQYRISVIWFDGCNDIYSSTALSLTLAPIPTPTWNCQSQAEILSDKMLTIYCKSNLNVNSLPYHLEVFQNGDWVDFINGTASSEKLVIRDIKLPTGKNSLRIRTENVTNKYIESISTEINVRVLPSPYSTNCSVPTSIREGQNFGISCSATTDLSGAVAHLEYLSGNGSWIEIQDQSWVSRKIFFNMNFSGSGTGTLRVVTDAESGKNLGNISPQYKVVVTAKSKSSSNSLGKKIPKNPNTNRSNPTTVTIPNFIGVPVKWLQGHRNYYPGVHFGIIGSSCAILDILSGNAVVVSQNPEPFKTRPFNSSVQLRTNC